LTFIWVITQIPKDFSILKGLDDTKT